MTWIKRHAVEGLAWFFVLPTTALTLANADLAQLALGAFGPPPRVVLARWLAAAACLASLALWRARRRTAGAPSRAASRARVLLVLALASLALVFVRGRGVATRTVTFAGSSITIAATIYEPRTPGRHPAVVFVHGSAAFKRGFYALWAEHLAKTGIVCIVTDKRGVGGTGGEFERNNNTSRTNLDLLASDVVAALDFAARLPSVDGTRLGLFGLSQAGWVAPMAAVQSQRAHFMVLISGPAVSVHEEGVWSKLRGDDARAATRSRTDAERVMDTVTIGGVDPRSRLAALDIPGLWLFGLDDNSVPARKSVHVLDGFSRLGKHFQVDTFAGAGHLLFTRAGGLLPHVVGVSWDAIDRWLAQEVKPLSTMAR